MASVLCKRALSLKLRRSTYNGCVKSAICCGTECWALKKTNERKLQAAEMRMLRMICGKTLREDISNETIRKVTDVEKIAEILKEQRLQ